MKHSFTRNLSLSVSMVQFTWFIPSKIKDKSLVMIKRQLDMHYI